MADSLSWIANNPARTYWNPADDPDLRAAFYIRTARSTVSHSAGLDQYCGHFLERELAEGTITPEKAQEMADAFILKLGDYFVMFYAPLGTDPNEKKVYHYECGGHHFTVGGQTKDGQDATNTLTLLFLQTYARLYLTIPSLSVRIHKYTPYEVWEHAVESSKIAGGMPTLKTMRSSFRRSWSVACPMRTPTITASSAASRPAGCGK